MQPKISLVMSGNLYLRQMRFEDVGDTEIGHVHTYDHLTLLSQGRLEVITDDAASGVVYEAPSAIKILAGVKHKLVAHQPGTIAHCIHALRDGVTEEVLPAHVVHTDEGANAMHVDGNTTFLRPSHKKITVDGSPAQLAYIARVDGEINGGTFNRNMDDKPLQVFLPSGEVVSRGFA